MAEIKDQTVSGRVNLDGNRYVNCQFKDAQIYYEGGKPPEFDNVGFHEGCTFTFQEQAGNTLAFLRSMAHKSTNMRFIVNGLMPELQD